MAPLPSPIAVPEGFLDAAEALGVILEPEDLERMGLYLALLLSANESVNLTAIRDEREAWTRHILDSLSLVGPLMSVIEHVDEHGAEATSGGGGDARIPTIIDVGSGGGVPGLPLAIALPTVRVTLLEPTGKKADFLRSTIRSLGLSNARVIQQRAEVAGQDRERHREHYDAAVCRAVAMLDVICEYCLPLVRPGGVFLAIKGERAGAEVTHASRVIGMLGGAYDQTIPSPTGQIVVIAKNSRTPRIYPRRDGEPKTKPLAGKMEGADGGERGGGGGGGGGKVASVKKRGTTTTTGTKVPGTIKPDGASGGTGKGRGERPKATGGRAGKGPGNDGTRDRAR